MKKLITESQKREIEQLAVEHKDAIIAAMADMYREGYIKGAVCGAIIIVSFCLTEWAIRKIRKNERQKEEES